VEQNEFFERLITASDDQIQQQLLRKAHQKFDQLELDWLAERLKEQVISFLWSDTQVAIKIADLILYLAELADDFNYRALGLRAKAQALMLGMGEFDRALELYDEAIQIYQLLKDCVGEARVNVTRIWALANLGFNEQVAEDAEKAIHILKEHSLWRSLATLQNNLATIHNRAGNSKLAFELHTEAREAYLRLGEEGEQFLATSELNLAWDYYELTQYEASIEASEKALALAEKFNQSTVAARANHNMGITYFRLGRNNEALQIFETAKDIHLSSGQLHEAALCELTSLACLSELRRFEDILSICQDIIPIFTAKGMQLEAAETIHFQAMSFSKLGRYQEAIDALQRSRQLFVEEGNSLWISLTDLETAAMMHGMGDTLGCLITSQQCILDFEKLDHRLDAAFARLVAGRAAFELKKYGLAENLTREAMDVANAHNTPLLIFQGFKLLGQLFHIKGKLAEALIHYDQAISALEKLSGNVMSEYHAGFVEDKESVYQTAVLLAIQTDQPELALAYAERAKSRTLLKILAFRPELGIRARKKEDEPLVAKINSLRLERERLMRNVDQHRFDPEIKRYQEKITTVERQVTALWHKLLVRNAEYAQDASLWQVQVEDAQPYLDQGSLMLEYFFMGEEIIVFLISAEEGISIQRLSATRAQIEQHMQLLNLNFRAVMRSRANHVADLITNAQNLLGSLYQSLLGPIDQHFMNNDQLIIVPHGALHYLPFHALYDGQNYLIENYSISYLPGASFLRYSHEMPTSNEGVLVIGHSNHDQIPQAVIEAKKIAQIYRAEYFVEDKATLEQIRASASGNQILHIACHGEFHADNPLFSGLAVENGWLTTLDVFNLQLDASLVTLSACETGRSMVGGGDELLGISRAFLAAGAASLLISHWAVEDHSTLVLMEALYKYLKEGKTKSKALQAAQSGLLLQDDISGIPDQKKQQRYKHPYYWAPFFLTGDFGKL
jgi:CHAT domain-containing protein